MKLDFRERLKQGPILCDGAMGTLLDMYEYEERPHEIQNIKSPEIIERVHREYIQAGAEIIETNTFSGNRLRLAQFHLEDKLEEINRRAVEIARQAAGENVYVAGAVGPTGKLLEPIGKLKFTQARDAFKEQIEILLKTGIDVLILETFVSLQELDEAITAAKELTNLPIIAQKAFPEDGSILSGTFPLEVVEHLLQRGVDVVGANCTVGPQRMFSIIRTMYKDGVYLSAQPAAGIPTLLNGRSVYHTTPEYLAAYAKELVQAGVTLIGACCGSTPAHIRAIRTVLNEIQMRGKPEPVPSQPRIIKSSDSFVAEQEEAAVIQADDRSLFARHVGKKFLTSVELDIPRGLDMSSVIEGARYLHRCGVDAINITDGARARLRMSSIAISYSIQQQVGIEAMTHLTTRDRNMLGLQSELLGAHALGLRNILCITGDPTSIGDYPHATSVFDVDSSGLIRAVNAMNNGKDLMGNTIEQKTSFFIACAANAMADNMETELVKLEKKITAGAQIIYTQPIYDMRTLEQFLKRIAHWHIPVMLGLLPLRSYKHAEFLHNEIPGMTIPDPIREKLRHAG
ncbi:MAG: bifunctional homocysteine S-methyltransferase/methylenetetrahydrofolate reductase, partial [Ignavibacteriales bacterium]|nr:bifunctional homocysteine S-methyltransferase/methylenetetrahydrofolate reductase [Ignavibacteriales bacterium]